MVRFCTIFGIGFLAAFSATAQDRFRGICDASAGVSVGPAHMIVAQDEENLLYLYRTDGFGDGQVLREFDYRSDLHKSDKDSDLEGAARIGQRLFWISSHGRNGKGAFKKRRSRFFATDLQGDGGRAELVWVGQYRKMLRDMRKAENWVSGGELGTLAIIKRLKEAIGDKDRTVDSLAPKDKGLNIEALAVQADGSGFLIGFRNPVPKGKALIVPLENGEALVDGSADAAVFGRPVMLDLGGLGLRSMEYVAARGMYLLVAGPIDSEAGFKLFQWSGAAGDPAVLLGDLRSGKGISPEAVVVYAGNPRVQILHDEGKRDVEGGNCNDETAVKQSFTDQWYLWE